MAISAAVRPPKAPHHRHIPNPLGNPNLRLSPRCGARTRAGTACQAPALHGKHRCRMHGGGSTGPRTEAGMARMRAARTIHGGYGATWRAWEQHTQMMLRRTRVLAEMAHWIDHLPPDLVARGPWAPELRPPPAPTRGITRQEDKAIRQQEKAALAPWWQAVEAARAAARARRARNGKEPHAPVELAPRGVGGARAGFAAWAPPQPGKRGLGGEDVKEPHAPVTAVRPAEGSRQNCTEPHAPVGGMRAAVAPTEGEAVARLHAAWLAGVARASAAKGAPVRTQAEAPAPVEIGGRVAAVRVEQKQAHAPVTGAGATKAAGALRGERAADGVGGRGSRLPRPAAPARGGEGQEPPTPVGLTRKQRKRWKWLRRQAAKGR